MTEQDRIAADVLLRLLQCGAARFEPSTREFCFDGLRYSTGDCDWVRLLDLVGRERAEAVAADAGRTQLAFIRTGRRTRP